MTTEPVGTPTQTELWRRRLDDVAKEMEVLSNESEENNPGLHGVTVDGTTFDLDEAISYIRLAIDEIR